MANSLLGNFTGLIINSSKVNPAPNTPAGNTNKTIKNYEAIKDKPDQDDLPVAKEPDPAPEKDGSITITSRLFDPIAKTNAYAIVMVILLRDNAPDKILELISKLPFIGAAGFIGRIALDKPLKWLNQQIKEQGEAYIMENLVERWKANNITYDELAEKIESIPDIFFTYSIKPDAINLLNTYYLDTNSLISGQIYPTKNTTPDGTKICKICSTINKYNAKFCCECGHSLFKEKLCLKCNWILLPNFRFCPICGTKIPDTSHKLLSKPIPDAQCKPIPQYHGHEEPLPLDDKPCDIPQTEKSAEHYFCKLAIRLYESEKNNVGASNTTLVFINKSFLYIWQYMQERGEQHAKEVWVDLKPLLMDEDACFNILLLFYSRIIYLAIITQKDAEIQKRIKLLFTKSIIYIGNNYFIKRAEKEKTVKINSEAIKQQIIARLKDYILMMMSKQENIKYLARSFLGNLEEFSESDSIPANLIESVAAYVESRDHHLIQFIKLIIREDFYSKA